VGLWFHQFCFAGFELTTFISIVAPLNRKPQTSTCLLKPSKMIITKKYPKLLLMLTLEADNPLL